MIGDLVAIGMVIEGLRPDVFIMQRCLAPRQKTQADMNSVLRAEGVVISLALRYQWVLKYVFFALFYSPAQPITVILAFVFLGVSFWADKRLFLFSFFFFLGAWFRLQVWFPQDGSPPIGPDRIPRHTVGKLL